MKRDDIYQKIGEALCRNIDYHVIDTDDGIALIGDDPADVWLIVVNEATLKVTAP